MAFTEWLLAETSIHSLFTYGNRDIYLILLSRYLRMFAYGGAALVLGILLWRTGTDYETETDKDGKNKTKFTDNDNVGLGVGVFMTLTLLGDAVLSYMLTVNADKIGRRRVIMIGSCFMSVAGVIFMFVKNYYILLIAAIVGVVSPGAHELGPFRAVQESILAQLTPLEARTDMYAWFAVASTLGMASGLCVCGYMTYIFRHLQGWDWKDPEVYSNTFILYTILGLVKIGLAWMMSEECEANYVRPKRLSNNGEADDEEVSAAPLLPGRRSSRVKTAKATTSTARRISSIVTTKLSPDSRGVLIRLCIVFAVNSFAQGMIPVTLMSWYANWRYRWFLTYRIGYAMALVWLVASVANLFSASVARRLGLVRAMVFTHLPNAIFLGFIPLASDWKMLFFLLLLSSAFGSMDQAPRAAFVAAVFSPSERTAVIGILNMVRTVASSGGPLLTGYLHDKDMWHYTFVIAAVLKVLYDVGVLSMFLKTKIPEQGRDMPSVAVADMDVGILLHDVRPEEFGGLEVDDMSDEEPEDNERLSHGKVTYEGV